MKSSNSCCFEDHLRKGKSSPKSKLLNKKKKNALHSGVLLLRSVQFVASIAVYGPVKLSPRMCSAEDLQ